MSKITVTTIAGLTSGGDANTVKIESGDAFQVVSGATTLGGTASITGNTTVGGTLGVTGATTLTDDLTVDTNTLFVDASDDKVGINNTTPGSYLSSDLVVGDATGDNAITVVSGNANASGIFFQDTTGVSIVSGVRYQHDINKMGLWTNGGEKIGIDSGGRVSMPNVPRFLARRNESNWSPSANATMVWDNTSINNGYNVGSHYNTSNGKFTCPVAGTYHFLATAIVNQSVSNGAWYIMKNGSQLHAQHISQPDTSWHAHHIAYTGDFAANDAVEVYLGGSPTGFYGQAWSYFHGRMIG